MAGPGNAHDRDARAAERFEQLFRSHHRAVAAYARRRAPGDTSDDVVASTFLVAWRRSTRCLPIRCRGSWPLPET